MKHEFNLLKYHTANTIYKHEIITSLVLATAIGSGTASLFFADHEYDNFSNKETVIEVQDLNNQITELNTKYIEANKDDTINSDRKELIKDIEYDLASLEYDLLSSPISEISAKNVLETFNGTVIADEYKLTEFDYFKGLNDLKVSVKTSDYSNTLSGKFKYSNDLQEEVNRHQVFERNPAESYVLLSILTFAIGALPFLGILTVLESKGKDWKVKNKQKPARARKKKLSVASQNKNSSL